MSRYLFDIESDGLLDEMTKIHCIVIKDLDSGAVLCFHKGIPGNPYHEDVEAAVHLLQEADLIAGHNVLKFDIPAIQKFYPWFKPKGLVRDTLVMSRLIWPNMMELDAKAKVKDFPKQLTGRHSLEAWGYRLGAHKGDFAKQTDWKTFTPEMLEYCVQDVVGPTQALWDKIQSKNYSEEAIQNEHDFSFCMFLMTQHGFRFDEKAAQQLHAKLGQRRLELERELQVIFPGWSEDMKTPEYWDANHPAFNTRAATKADAEEGCWEVIKKVTTPKRHKRKDIQLVPGPLKKKVTPFNPGSRDHLARVLIENYGWRPKAFGKDGKPTLDEEVMESLTFPEVKPIQEYFMLEKRLGMLAEGEQAWLKLSKDGVIYGDINEMGTKTSRVSHSKPNLGQVVAVDKPYGKEFRALFLPDKGHVLVGTDAKGIQLRVLAHYLARWDEGAYARIVCEGDPHTANQKFAGLPTRESAKTFIYAWLLGAGDELIGSHIGKGKAAGREIKARFLQNFPGMADLKERIKQRVNQTKSITGLDGRIMPVENAHYAFGSLLQGFEAVVMKKATWLSYKAMTDRGWVHGKDFALCAFVHDELQISARPEIAEEVGKIVVQAIKDAGVYFKSNCPLDGEYKIGGNWCETH